MRRRALLSAAGTTLGAALFAGCTGPAAPGGDDSKTTTAPNETTTTEPSDPTRTTTDDGDIAFDPGSETPFEEIDVGSRENVLMPRDNNPHSVSVWNAADGERDLRLVVTADGEGVLDRTVAFPADGYLRMRLLEPANYEVSVGVDGETAGTITVGTGWFDCNGSETEVGVFPDGRVEDRSISTLALCGPPNVADHSFEVTGTQCGETDDGSLSVEGQTVRLDGRLRAPDPCHGATLSVDGYGAEDVEGPADSITLLVSATGSEGVCQQCVGEVSYEGAVTFEESVPETVRLVHGSERVEVARVDG